MPDEVTMVISTTETRQYRRIIEFVREVHDHAIAADDEVLGEIVRETLDDLLGMALDA